LSDRFNDGIRGVLEYAEEVARGRIAKAERRARDVEKYGADSWELADLAAEVQAISGEGQRRGSDCWFHCPFGHSRRRTPSLHVDARRRIWHCFACQRGGGVLAWRDAVKGVI
jgi:hypothetical protein